MSIRCVFPLSQPYHNLPIVPGSPVIGTLFLQTGPERSGPDNASHEQSQNKIGGDNPVLDTYLQMPSFRHDAAACFIMCLCEMRSIRYSLHFPLLIVAMLVFWLAKGVYFPYWIANFDLFHYGLMGALHATCIVVSLRDRKANLPIIALCFITLATIWAAVTPIWGLWGSVLWTPLAETLRRSDFRWVFLLLTGSAIGAAGYWLLVRLFWLKSLLRADCFRTVALCVAATLLSYAVLEVLPQSIADRTMSLMFTTAWWFAFSISLYWSEMTRYPNKSAEAMVNAT